MILNNKHLYYNYISFQEKILQLDTVFLNHITYMQVFESSSDSEYKALSATHQAVGGYSQGWGKGSNLTLNIEQGS